MYKEYEPHPFSQPDEDNTAESLPLIDLDMIKSYSQKSRRLGRRLGSLKSAESDLKNLDKKNNEFANRDHSSGLHNDLSGLSVDRDGSQPTCLSSPMDFLRAKSKSPVSSNCAPNRDTSSSLKENRNPHHADLKFHQSTPFFLSSQCSNRNQNVELNTGTSQKPSFMFSSTQDMNRTYLVEKNNTSPTVPKEESVEPLNLSQHHDYANKSIDRLQFDSVQKLSMPELLNKHKSLSPEYQTTPHCNRTVKQDRILQPNNYLSSSLSNNNQNLFHKPSSFVQKETTSLHKEPPPAHKELSAVQKESTLLREPPPAHKELSVVQKELSTLHKHPPPAHKEVFQPFPIQKRSPPLQKEPPFPVQNRSPPLQKEPPFSVQKQSPPLHKEPPAPIQKQSPPELFAVPKDPIPVRKEPSPEHAFKRPAEVAAVPSHKQRPVSCLNITRAAVSTNQPQQRVPPAAQQPLPVDNKANIIYVNSKPYISLSLLGKGGTSKVFLVQDPSSNKLKAIKCVDLSRVDQMFANAYLNEIELLIKLQECDTVIKMFDHEYLENERMLYVVLEKGDTDFTRLIRNLSKEKNEKDPFMIFYYWGQILKAVKDIHDRGIIHSDLKPDNFLLVQGKLKLIDFGIASSLSGDMTSVLLEVTFGTLNYISPEAIPNGHASKHGYKISCKSDVWSLGCILYNLVYGKTPFSHLARDWIKMQAIVDTSHVIEFPEEVVGWRIPLFLLESMKQCLNRDPKQRPTVADLISRLKSVCDSISFQR
ncbi:dual specificity protein kinase TTK [Nilaparvata lugens]|uniref:dual specificity protein kinase TTK n=1 Tax=Nilaparvata lugens TaxID=108931 RepID=UPI00193E9F25|nr:dual specificity protein kinase TTK [Nilaparvata lugens]